MRFFAALRMTGGRKLRMTGGGRLADCHVAAAPRKDRLDGGLVALLGFVDETDG